MDKSTLLGNMPSYYVTSLVVDNINNANAIELTTFKNSIIETLNQFFIETATYTLPKYERELGIEVNNSLDYYTRRSRLKSKLRGQGTVTIKLIENVAESFMNGEVNIIEDNANYSFTVKFVGEKGIPPNIDDLKKAIEDIKPAHLAVIYAYNYTTWGEVKKSSWGFIKQNTWGNLKLSDDVEVPKIYKTWDEASTMVWNDFAGYIWGN